MKIFFALSFSALLVTSTAGAFKTRNLAADYRILVNFEGAATIAGTLDDVNTRLGTTITTEQAFPDVVDLGDPLGCFELPMLETETKVDLGQGIDCLYGNPTGGVAAITFFVFECGTLVHSGLTSTAPYTEGVGTGPIAMGSPNVDTLSGSLPEEEVNTLLPGVGEFASATGNVRLSGSLHLTTEPWFDCLWEINASTDSAPSCGLHPDDSSASILLPDEDDPAAQELEVEPGQQKGFALVQFLGKGTSIGELEDANAMMGTEVTLQEAFPGMDLGDAPSLGCHQVAMVDMQSKQDLGTGIDCLWGVNGGVAAVSYYQFGNGLMVNAGLTSLQPFFDGVGTNAVSGPGSPTAILMSGSFPDTVDADTLLVATGDFENYKGNIRLSGAVVPGGPDDDFYFNCIWQFYVEKPDVETGGGEDSAAYFASAGWASGLFALVVAAGVGGMLVVV